MKRILISEKIKASYIQKHPLFRQLPKDEFSAICRSATLVKLKKSNPYLLNQESQGRIFFIASGTAKLVQFDKSGQDLVKDILVDGEVFGDFAFSNSNVSGYIAGLRTPTYMFWFSASELKRILFRNHTLSLNYMEMISRKLLQLEDRHLVWTSSDARMRLLYFFQQWASCAGIRSGDNVVLENYFALIDIAEFIGVTRQFMHTMLKELRNEKLIDYSRRQIVINTALLGKDADRQKLTG